MKSLLYSIYSNNNSIYHKRESKHFEYSYIQFLYVFLLGKRHLFNNICYSQYSKKYLHFSL